jgi:phosphoribosylanthranilate isomerase
MKIKICGLNDPENIYSVAGLSPDHMGFICYDQSPRFISKLLVETLGGLPDTIKKTAVFVNEKAETIIELIGKYNFDAIQLHGKESPEFSNQFREKVTVIKAFGLNRDFDFEQLEAYVDKIDYFLFDTKTDLHGGSGKAFDWRILDMYKLAVPFFLSGGLGLDNIERVIAIDHPQFYGVDLNSKFETSPGIKDIEKLKKAFDIIKQYNEVRS